MLLHWVGGKGASVARILDKLPLVIHEYHEPFLGGGAVLEAVLRSGRVRGAVHASDLNAKLVAVFLAVKTDPDGLIAALEHLALDVSAEAYYAARARFNAAPTPALFVYLNKLCFRGLYRENMAGEFNVPFGNYKTPKVVDPAAVRQLAELYRLHDVRFAVRPWEDALAAPLADPRACVFLDPPFAKLAPTTFVAYTSGGFGPADGTRLLARVREARARVVFCNHDVPEVVTALAGWDVERFSARRAIHCKRPGSRAWELLASNQHARQAAL